MIIHLHVHVQEAHLAVFQVEDLVGMAGRVWSYHPDKHEGEQKLCYIHILLSALARVSERGIIVRT